MIPINTNDIQINEMIRDREVRLIGPDGKQLGIFSADYAYNKAKELDLDLVKISPNVNPPVCKIIDFGKYRYDMMKKEREAKKNQKQVELKEIRMTPNIDVNDLKTKINAGRKFLEKGNRLKVTLRFRGREMIRMNDTKHMLTDFAKELEDVCNIEKEPKIEGKNISIILSSKK